MRLLLVEDDPRMSGFLLKGLRENSYEVDLVSDGEEALKTAQSNTYDALVLDVMLPRVDGFAVCRQLRTAGSRVPILMLTARDAIEDKIAGLDLGADDYLTKPFEFAELLARLRALFRRNAGATPSSLYVGDLVIDVRAQRAFRGGKTIPLSSKEYSLLEYLARNAGRVVPRQEIAEHVWDSNFDPFSNLIEVYINRLRRKVDHGRPSALIHTRRGAGYMLDDASAAASAAAEQKL
jgi:DNA-binding response OmpR family regulator